jgi:hypothetical protein
MRQKMQKLFSRGNPAFLLQNGGESLAGYFEVPISRGCFGVVTLDIEPFLIAGLTDDDSAMGEFHQVYI